MICVRSCSNWFFKSCISETCRQRGKRRGPFWSPCEFHNPFSDTCLHYQFCRTCVSDGIQRVEQIRCSLLLRHAVKIRLQLSIPYQGSFQISSRNLRYLLQLGVNPNNWSGRYLSTFHSVFEWCFHLETEIYWLKRVHYWYNTLFFSFIMLASSLRWTDNTQLSV